MTGPRTLSGGRARRRSRVETLILCAVILACYLVIVAILVLGFLLLLQP